MLVHDFAQCTNAVFKHTVRAWVGHHDAGQFVAVRFALGLQVCHVDIAMGIAGNDHHTHAAHLRAGRVGAMGAGGYQTDRTLAVTTGCMPGTDGEQAGIFAL